MNLEAWQSMYIPRFSEITKAYDLSMDIEPLHPDNRCKAGFR